MDRREFLFGLHAAGVVGLVAATPGEKVAAAARAQVGVTLTYDPRYVGLTYPNGDVPRATGVCADVVVRAARDGVGLDLQKLVHEDMVAEFAVYPHIAGMRRADANIDHRRVVNLECFWKRAKACVWSAKGPAAGDSFPGVAVGDFVTWLLDARLPHVGVIAAVGGNGATVIHNIGRGVEETELAAFRAHRAVGLFRWPKPA